jgi:fatty-acyl-CoA synthase
VDDAAGGRHAGLPARRQRQGIYDAIADEGITHFGGAPIVLNTIINAATPNAAPLAIPCRGLHRRRPAPRRHAGRDRALGFNVKQVYGLTETYGPVTECLWNDDWDALPQTTAPRSRRAPASCMPMGG